MDKYDQSRVIVVKLDNTCSEIPETKGRHINKLTGQPHLVFAMKGRYFLRLAGQATITTSETEEKVFTPHYTEIAPAAATAIFIEQVPTPAPSHSFYFSF